MGQLVEEQKKGTNGSGCCVNTTKGSQVFLRYFPAETPNRTVYAKRAFFDNIFALG
jgi:hypothetical protein